MTVTDEALSAWMQALEERHLADLRVQEVTRALRALSSVYVERRASLARGAALDSAGKRAAFALFYGPLHYLVTRAIVRSLNAQVGRIDLVVDLGCGTGAAGAAWAVAIREAGMAHAGPRVFGVDRHPWAAAEARWTYTTMGLQGTARREDVTKPRVSGHGSAVVLAFTVNEIDEASRELLLPRLVRAANEGARLLVVEPVAKSIGPWWREWATAFREAGGREDTWRFDADLPARLRLFDKAAGLDHRVLTARSLYFG